MKRTDLERFPTRKTALEMMDMISPIYDTSYVGKWLFQVLSGPIELSKNIAEELQDQAFPQTATWGLRYWEEAYGVPVNETDSIDVRRKRLLEKMIWLAPMNPARIARLVTSITGRSAKIIENTAPHAFDVCISDGPLIDISTVYAAVRKAKQPQKHIRIVIDIPVGLNLKTKNQRIVYPYNITSEHNTITGTYPNYSIGAAVERVPVELQLDDKFYPVSNTKAGTKPQRATIGNPDLTGVGTKVDAQSVGFVYKICGAERKL